MIQTKQQPLTVPYNQPQPYGTVLGRQPVFGRVEQVVAPASSPNLAPHQPPEASLPRSLNYYADYSGCGHWRMIWPEQLLNAYQKSIIHGSSVMILDERYYAGCKTVRIQRQATQTQLSFMKYIRDLCGKHSMRMVYEIDDICFKEDIPDYNKFKFAFDDENVRSAIKEMMELTDEMTVTCDYMKEYYTAKTDHKQITVIPNYLPKFWIGNHYSKKKIERDFRNNVRRPRVLYAGSGAHFDVAQKVGGNDDFAHVMKTIADTVDDFQWVFMGGHPLALAPLVRAGKIEFHPWKPLYDYPQQIHDLNVNCMVAPLQDNVFNRAKSNLKYIEACAFGIPIVCQDMCTYSDAQYKFTTGDDMIDAVKSILKGTGSYMKISDSHRAHAETMWLEDNIDCYYELYNFEYGSPERVNINKLNSIAQ